MCLIMMLVSVLSMFGGFIGTMLTLDKVSDKVSQWRKSVTKPVEVPRVKAA